MTATLSLSNLADLAPAVDRCRRLLDADADPVGIAEVLAADTALAAAVRAAPGLRLPGAVDGPEILIRALVGQQVSVAAARTKLATLTVLANERIDPVQADSSANGVMGGPLAHDGPYGGPDDTDPAALAAQLTHLFPSPQALAALGPDAIAGPRSRAHTLIDTATDMASGTLVVDSGRRTADLAAELVVRSGIGPWTAGYVAMRVLGDPDVLLTGDLALRHGAAALGLPDDPRELTARAERWRPFRSYAGMYLWRNCPPPTRSPRTPSASISSSPLPIQKEANRP